MTVATISNSKAVCDLLLAVAARQDRLQVMVSESVPGGEGVAFAHSLEHSCHHVTLLSDDALLARLDRADRVILGADAVFSDGVVNKVGSLALAQAARRLGRELWVIAESQKWAPKAWGVETARVEVPADQKSAEAPASTSVLLFEPVAAPLVTLLVSEHGSEPFARVAPRLDEKPVCGPLLAL
jgi:translation initiation factor 2B subunit (eIF-2B alpha/beta/delta family)